MYTTKQLRNRLNFLRKENPQTASKIFKDEFYEQIGIRKKREGSDVLEEVRDETGAKAIAPNSVPARDFSLADLAEMVYGRDEFNRQFDPEHADNDVMEAGPGQDPTTLQHANLYRSLANGMVEAEMLKEPDDAKLIGKSMIGTKSTRKNGSKLRGLHGDGGKGAELTRNPNEPHSRGSIGTKRLETPETVEKARAIDLTIEDIFFDETGEVLDRAASVGYTLKYEQEEQILRTMLGIDNSYKYNGVGYNTFLESGAYVNTHVNPFVNYESIDNAIELFTKLRHPETKRVYGLPSEAMTILHDPRKESMWGIHTNASQLRATNGSSQAISGNVKSITNLRDRQHSAIVRDLLVASGMSEAEAIETWFCGRPEKAFVWMENWALRIKTVAATEYDMIDRGIHTTFFASQRGTTAVLDPREWHCQKAA